MSDPYARFIVIRKKVKMAYNRQAHELMESTLQVLRARQKVNGVDAYAYMTGLLMPNISLTDAKRIAKLVLDDEKEGK